MIARNGHDDGHAREITRGLVTAVNAAVATLARSGEGSALAWTVAVDVAEILDLAGLAAVLTACGAHASAPPVAVTHVVERLLRIAHEAEADGNLESFTRADRELGALAGLLGEQRWAAPSESVPTPLPVQSVSGLLSDFDMDDAAAMARAELTLPVSAGLRAALDWIGADQGGPLRVSVHDATLTLTARVTHEPGLAAAGAVLALTGGTLLPEPDGRWALRVPLHAECPGWLLARQGELSLALPWYAVARLRIADDAARAAFAEPSLEPWSPLARSQGERPTALLALGLSSAWLPLDHIIWRVFASPLPGLAPPEVPGAHSRVRTDDGDEFWVVDPAVALRAVPALHTPPPQPRSRKLSSVVAPEPGGVRRPAPPPAPMVEARVPVPTVPPAMRMSTPDIAARPPQLTVLGPEHVRPLGAVTRRALLVDDSLVARMALARALELEGWVVEGAESAAEMWHALETQHWNAVFVDVCLPDAAGRAHLDTLVARRNVASPRFEVIALTRDAAEDRLVAATGITRALRKPFAAGVVKAVLRALTPPAAGV